MRIHEAMDEFCPKCAAMKTILATTDFTKSSLSAVNYAASMAVDLGAKLLVMHATHIPVVSDAYFDMRITMESLEKEDQASLDKLVAELQVKFGPELKINKKLQVGFTGDIIRETVQKGDVSIVIMGITHSDKFSEVVFGSTSTTLAGTVSCPVLIIPEGAKYKPWSQVAFAFDQKNIPTGTGVRTLKELLAHFQSKLRFVNVMDNPFVQEDDTVLKPLYKIFKDIDIKTYFLNHRPNMTVEIIMDWVRRHKASALVVVSRDHNLLWRMFNERVTRKIAFHSKVPVLVLSEKKQH
jgi:nucleotide-binding universal stress UspA family protein